MKKLLLLFAITISLSSTTWAEYDQTWMDLDGTDDFLDFGTDSILANKTQFTVEMRMHFDNSTGDYTLIGQRTADFNRTIVLQRWAGSFYLFLSNGNWGYCSFIPCEAYIYHIAIVYDGAGISNGDRLKLYINGVSQTLTFNATIDTVSYVTSPAANLVLGCEHNGPSAQLQFVNGQIGEFVVWNYPLTSTEINNRIIPEVTGIEPGLVEYFHFDNGTPNGNNTGITSFAGGNGISTITPRNMAMTGTSSNFVGQPSLASPVDTSVSVLDSLLTANATGATYQWLDCNNGSAAIPGETFQSYVANIAGNYAVEVKQGACVDTSSCIQINPLGISDLTNGNFIVYPNPVQNELFIENKASQEKLFYEILNSIGQVVSSGNIFDKTIVYTPDFSSGIYLLKIKSGEGFLMKKIVKE